MLVTSPLSQFDVIKYINIMIGGIDLSISNSTFTIILILFIIYFFSVILEFKIYPNNWLIVFQYLYLFIVNLIKDQIGVQGNKYITLIFSLFTFILLSNLLSMIPYSFAVTSHIIITFGLSFTLFIGITLIGLILHNYHFFSLFIPQGVPMGLVPLITSIEIISYLSRPFSLGIRLAANIFSGHTLLNIISLFTFTMIPITVMILPIILIILLIFLELIICFLQAYVFTVLIISYLNDVINLH